MKKYLTKFKQKNLEILRKIILKRHFGKRIMTQMIAVTFIFSIMAGFNTIPVFAATGIPVISSGIGAPTHIIFDKDGNMFIAGYSLGKIFKVTRENINNGHYITTQYGNQLPTEGPQSMVFDSSGNLFVVVGGPNSSNGSLYEITPDGTTNKILSNLGSDIYGMVLSIDGKYLYVSNRANGNCTIIKININDLSYATFTNIPVSNGWGWNMIMDKYGNIYITMLSIDKVYKVLPDGSYSVYATLNSASGPSGIDMDSQGNIFIGNRTSKSVMEITRNLTQITIGQLNDIDPEGLALDPVNNNIYIANFNSQSVVLFKTGSVTANYVDEDTNASIATSDMYTGFQGNTYNIGALNIPSYTLDTSSQPNTVSGTFSSSPQTVTFYYKKFAPISNLALTAKTQITADLSFSAATGATSVAIEYSTDGGNTWNTATTSAALNSASTSVQVTGLTAGTTYKFKLVVAGGSSAGDSNVISVTTDTAPTPISNLALTAKTGTTADLSFSAATGATSVAVEYSTDGGSTWNTATTSAALNSASTSAQVTGLTAGTTYKFKLVVTGGSSAGDSNVIIVELVPITVTASSNGITAAAGTTTITLGQVITGLSAGDIVVKKNGTVLTSGTSYTLKGLTSTSVGIAFNTSAGLDSTSVVTVEITKTGYIINSGKAISVTNTIPPTASSDRGDSSTSSSKTTTTTVTGSVVDRNTTKKISDVSATVTTDSNGNIVVSVNATQAVTMEQLDKSVSAVSDLSKVNVITADGTPISISSNGTIDMHGLAKGTDNKYEIAYDLGNGQKVVIGTIEVKVADDGTVTLKDTLIDPYGIITDGATGKAVPGVKITLYYANTDRNKANGKTPDTVVALPSIDGFNPNNNSNPQNSNVNGAYGLMVFPNTDYYLVAEINGYNKYISPTISVEKEIVKWDFKMNKTNIAADTPAKNITGVQRLAGATRVDTALAIAKTTYTDKVSSVILATADNYPDALAGSVLGYKLNAPILLVGSSDEDQQKVLDYMKSNMDSQGTVYILGGTGAVSENIESKIAASGFNNISRLDGVDRYETDCKIVDALKITQGTPIVIVSGENYADALSVSSEAAVNQYPILLVNGSKMPDNIKNEIAYIKPSKIYIVSSQGAVSTSLGDEAAKLAGIDNTKIVRISEDNKFETSLEVAKLFNLSGSSVCIATGNNFPDALAGSLYAAKNNVPIILTDIKLSDNQITYLKDKKMTGASIFGGIGAVSGEVEQQLAEIFGQ